MLYAIGFYGTLKWVIMMSERDNILDALGIFFIMTIGAAELAHIYGLFLHKSFTGCSKLMTVLAALVVVAAIVWHFFRREKQKVMPMGKKEWIPALAVLFLFLSQAVRLALWAAPDLQGDMTVETVNSFLYTDGVYTVNPLTGGALTGGMPTRLQILCLPTLYASLCKVTGLTAYTCVTKVIPVAVLCFAYISFAVLGTALFGKSRRNTLIFLLAVAALFWLGLNNPGSEGYRLLSAGFTGTAIRDLILVPLTVGWTLRRKYVYAALCVPAEACIVWTLYGLGICIVLMVALIVFQVIAAGKTGKEATE